jgi:hypothetical protein
MFHNTSNDKSISFVIIHLKKEKLIARYQYRQKKKERHAHALFYTTIENIRKWKQYYLRKKKVVLVTIIPS